MPVTEDEKVIYKFLRSRVFKRYICILLCLVLYITVLPLSVSAEEAKNRTVRVGWYEGTYNTTGPDGKKRGYSYEYQQAVAAHTGWKYEYVEGSWAELMNMLKSGEIDLMGGISYTEERSTSMLFSELPMGEDKYYLYVNPSDTDISASDLTTLNGKRIGVLPDTLSARRFCEWEKSHGVDTQQVDITSTDDARQKLHNQEIDGFVLNESPQWERDNISPALLIGGSYNYFAVSKKCPDLKEELDQAMRKIEKENPFYKEDLYKRYLSANPIETLTDEEQNWLEQHGAVRIGYLKNDVGISLVDAESEEPVGILNDYISLASNCMGEKSIEFQTTGFDSQEEELQALKDNRIDMIFHMNQNPYEAEQNDIILSNTVFEVNVAVLTGVEKFDENGENTVAVGRNNLLGKWYISFHYPFWRIKEYDSYAEVKKAVHSGEADCFVAKAGESLKTLEDSKMHGVFLTKSGDSCFAVTRENTTLMNILNKTIQTLPASRLSSLFSVYENRPGKVTLAEYIKDNLRVVSIGFVSVTLIIILIIGYLMIEARKAQIQAEKVNAAKSDFLFNMSHDIRTPMNALLGYSELMKRELTDPKLLDYQEKMEQSGNLLLSIINNVLDMARIESGKVELDEDYVQIRDIYHGVYKIFQAEAEKKGIRLEMEYEVQHEHIICDETKNREIFLNLISNAVKYTASGGTVTIRITEIDCDREDCVRIQTQVIDTGIGMSEEFLPSLFEAFSRERNTTAGKVAGTGLGMPIIKKYVDMMGGSIEAESKLGEGSKFTVIMEYRIADKGYYEQVTDPSPDTEETDRISGKHVLLAEDNELNAEIAEFILEDMGLIVDRVEDGIQCVARMEQKPARTYDLILMDIQMPNMDGYKATQTIRRLADEKKASIPIIAMTANAFEEDRKKALAKGMNGHIAKPVDAEKLKKTILSALR
ncbi:transporter substrate-binding domain-containing protein [Faecalicatena fissicatena]|nr:transporter substrate-binding domain-containing protein [Faecalicatena fissicatena]NSE33664.1 transporter substrate-binding domain-containing protein [Faecalicatena fissicatena]